MNADERDDTSAEARPALTVVHGGEPTPEEIAALVVALNAAAPKERAAPHRAGWSDRAPMLRKPLEHGPGRWAASTRPSR